MKKQVNRNLEIAKAIVLLGVILFIGYKVLSFIGGLIL